MWQPSTKQNKMLVRMHLNKNREKSNEELTKTVRVKITGIKIRLFTTASYAIILAIYREKIAGA